MEQAETLTKAERVRKYGEVFTPGWMAAKMCDELQKENPDAFLPDKTFLEPTCGQGVFLCEILKRKFSRCRKRSDFTAALKSVYGLELLPDNVEESIRQVTYLCTGWFQPTKAELEIIRNHIIQADALKIMKMWQDPAINDFIDAYTDICGDIVQFVDDLPAADVVEVVRCRDCIHRPTDPENKGYGMRLVFPDERCPCWCEDGWYSWMPPDDWFCANGERKDGDGDG